MSIFRKWVKNCFDNLVDPDKEFEVAELTQILHEGIARRKQKFVLADVLANRPYKQHHLDQARVALYQKFVSRAWNDGRMQPGERETLAWVARCLQLPKATLSAINLENARRRFAEALAEAMEDGEVSTTEAALLEEIAKAAGLSVSRFMREFFQSEGEAFLRGVFAAAVEENQLDLDVLERITSTAARLGLTRAEVLQAIQPQAMRLIEHVLADAKEDDILTAEEENTIYKLLKSLAAPADTRAYVLEELRELRLLTNIKQGKLPTLPLPRGMSLKAGELVHYHGAATWVSLKLLKSGPRHDEHVGLLTITDCRLLFSSSTRSDSFAFSRIVSFDTSHGAIALQLQSKPLQRFFCEGKSRIPATIFAAALAMANQTLRNQDESRRSRHIPRDIRYSRLAAR